MIWTPRSTSWRRSCSRRARSNPRRSVPRDAANGRLFRTLARPARPPAQATGRCSPGIWAVPASILALRGGRVEWPAARPCQADHLAPGQTRPAPLPGAVPGATCGQPRSADAWLRSHNARVCSHPAGRPPSTISTTTSHSSAPTKSPPAAAARARPSVFATARSCRSSPVMLRRRRRARTSTLHSPA
jgi:hypothetical protein